jgi:alkylated DNA repair dioxygenase AlkB
VTITDLQPSLFGVGLSADPAALGGLRRTDLGAGAWIDHLEGWLTDDLEVFDVLCVSAPWRQGSRVMYDRTVDVPRLTAWCTDPARLPHPTLVRAFGALNEHYGPEPFTSAGLCWYRDGRDSVAWHGDTIRHTRRETVIAIVSLGAARPLALRPRGGGRSRTFHLGHGDLFVMGGTCQTTWEHAVPKVRAAGPRISVQFRQAGVD